jgi:Tol biopolymer transport system component
MYSIRWILVTVLIAAMQVIQPLQVPTPVTPPESVNPQTYVVPVEEKLKRYDPEAMLASVKTKQPVDLQQLGNDVTDPFGTPYDVFVFEYASQTSWDVLSYQKGATPEVRYLANSGYHEIQPRMSPQRDRVAFVRADGTDYELVVVKADGTGLRQLTDNSRSEYYPAFSPDGQWIVYQSYQDGNSEIYKIKVDGSSRTRLTLRTSSYEGMPGPTCMTCT